MEEKQRKKAEDCSSPNGVLAAAIVALFVFTLFCGQSLWIPASRIANLQIRAIALAMTDAAASYSSEIGIDGYVPSLRSSFLDATGLTEHPDWDSRYFNRRGDLVAARSATVGAEASRSTDASPVIEKPSGNGQFAPVPLAMIGPLHHLAGAIPGSPDSAARSPDTGLAGPRRIERQESPHSPDNPLRVFFFGDSQVFSLGSGLSRVAGKGTGFSIDILAIHSSGFIRSDYYDWPAKLRDTLSQTPYDAAVMMLGMNDHQSFRDATGAVLKKETPEWEAAYKAKCREMIDLALSSTPRLYWIGMPLVKNRDYERSLEYIDRIQCEVASEYSPETVIRVSLKDAIPGAGKPYADTVTLEGGKPLRAMAGDGAHFTVEGGQVAMKPLFDRLLADYPFDAPPVAKLPE
jgi:hypothetical protein